VSGEHRCALCGHVGPDVHCAVEYWADALLVRLRCDDKATCENRWTHIPLKGTLRPEPERTAK
jgi:hypothetical protein